MNFQNFNLKFFKTTTRKIDWFNQFGVYTMPNSGHLAEIRLDTSHSSSNWDKYVVTIVNPASGTVTTKSFHFQFYLTVDPNGRKGETSLHAWRGSGNSNIAEWYIATPVSTKPVVDAIFKFIDLYDK